MSGQEPMRLGERREEVLARATGIVHSAWESFDHPRPVEPPVSARIAELLTGDLPSDPTDPVAALEDAAAALDSSIAQSRPRYFAYIGSSGLEIGAVADLLAHSYDVNLALDAGPASAIEAQSARWLGEFLGYPAAAGWFTSGGTLSNLSALVVARERALPECRERGLGTTRAAVYTSAESHYSVRRSVELIGLGSSSVRPVPIDQDRRLDPIALESLIIGDLAAGIVPVAVVATAGTTLTGAVDPLAAIADVCERHGIWMHVDGAYGLPAASTDRAPLFAGLDRADSMSVDAHKWMFVPKACSGLLTRHPEAFVHAFSHDEAYIPHEDRVPNAVDMTLEYSRPLRALKLWLAFRVHGANEFRAAIQRNLNQARSMYEIASAAADFETMGQAPELSIVPLRHVIAGCPNPETHNSALAKAIVADGRCYVSPAVIDGAHWLRPCLTNMRTTDADVEAFIEVTREIGVSICPTHG